MGLNLLNSLNDPVIPTYAAGTVSLTTAKMGAPAEFNNDFWNGKSGANYGAQNQLNMITVNAFNALYNTGWLSNDKSVVGGVNGRQT